MRSRAKRVLTAFRRGAPTAIPLALCLHANAARADDSQQFELLKGVFYGGQYEEVVRRLAILLDPSNPACAAVEGAPTAPQTCHFADTVLIERSREMQMVSFVALKRNAEADGVIEKMLRQNPTYTPEPGSLPAAVVERFREIKNRLQKELEDKARNDADAQRQGMIQKQKMAEAERKWIAEMTKLASQETIIEKKSRLFAFVPFGAGQFHNGDNVIGGFFAVSQGLAAGAAIGLGVAHAYYASVSPTSKDPITGNGVNFGDLNNLVQTLSLGNQIAFGMWAGLAIAGIVQANVAFVPEVKITRERAVPKRPEPPAVMPVVTVSERGAAVTFVGTF